MPKKFTDIIVTVEIPEGFTPEELILRLVNGYQKANGLPLYRYVEDDPLTEVESPKSTADNVAIA